MVVALTAVCCYSNSCLWQWCWVGSIDLVVFVGAHVGSLGVVLLWRWLCHMCCCSCCLRLMMRACVLVLFRYVVAASDHDAVDDELM